MSMLFSLKMNDQIYQTAESMLRKTKMSRNAYINRAVDFFNRMQKRKTLAKAFRIESKKVASESLRTLHAFEALEDSLP